MDAKEARAVTQKRKDQIAYAESILNKYKPNINVEKQEEEAIKSLIRFYESSIRRAAEEGKDCEDFPHPGDERYLKIAKYFEERGFHVSEHSTDEGYCIGDVWHILISW